MVPWYTIDPNALQTVEMFRRLGGQDEIYSPKFDRTMLKRKIDSQSDPVFPLLRSELEIVADCSDRFAQAEGKSLSAVQRLACDDGT